MPQRDISGPSVSTGPSPRRGVPRHPSSRPWTGRNGSENLQPSLNSRSSTSGRSEVGGVTAPPTSSDRSNLDDRCSVSRNASSSGFPAMQQVTIRKRPRTVLLENSFSAPVAPRIASSRAIPGAWNHRKIARTFRDRLPSVDLFLVAPPRHPSESASSRSPGQEYNLATDTSFTG